VEDEQRRRGPRGMGWMRAKSIRLADTDTMSMPSYLYAILAHNHTRETLVPAPEYSNSSLAFDVGCFADLYHVPPSERRPSCPLPR